MNDGIAILAGGLFVLVYAAHRFSTPSANRSSTTAVRYYTAATLYCLWCVFLYALIVTALRLSPEIAKSVSAASGINLPDAVGDLERQGVSAALIVALLLTTLLPNIPALAYVDRRVREQLEHMAAIPYELRRLAAELARSDSGLSGVTFRVPESLQRRVRQRLVEQEFLREDVVFDGRDLRALWTKLSTLVLQLQEWRAERRFSGFCESCGDKPEAIVQSYDELLPRVRRCLRALRAQEPDARQAEDGGPVAEYRAEVARQAVQLLGRVYHFISGATLHCELTQLERAERLTGLGFHFSEPWRPCPLLLGHRLVALFTMLFAVLLIGFSLRFHLDPNPTVGYMRVVGLSLMVPLTYVVAVFWAMFLKQRLAAISSRRAGTRPFMSYLLAAVLTALSNAPITLTWAMITGGAVRRSLVWLMLGATTAFVTAFLIDDTPRSLPRRLAGRWSEGATQALVTAAIAFVAYHTLASLGHAPSSPLAMVMGLAGTVGFVIGSLIPTWYREAPRRRDRLEGIAAAPRARRARRRARRFLAAARPVPDAQHTAA
jgi:hypothetical protein